MRIELWHFASSMYDYMHVMRITAQMQVRVSVDIQYYDPQRERISYVTVSLFTYQAMKKTASRTSCLSHHLRIHLTIF